MILLLKLLLAHFIGDFLLQPTSWVRNKEKKKLRSPWLYVHILLHGILPLLLVWDRKFLLPAVVLMVAHGIIDSLKLYLQNEKHKPLGFIIDQALHLLSIFIIWYCWTKPEFSVTQLFDQPQFWIFATALIFLTVVCNIVIQVLMTHWSKAIQAKNEESLDDAGKYIGILERILVFVFIVANQWAAVGFLLAAKSIFRFGDLTEAKDRKLTEYVLIGTFLSFGSAILTGMLVLQLI